MKKTYKITIYYKESEKHTETNKTFLVSDDNMKEAINKLSLVLENHKDYKKYKNFNIISAILFTEYEVIN